MAAPNRSLGIFLGLVLGIIVQIFGLILALIILSSGITVSLGFREFSPMGSIFFSIFSIGLYQLIYMIPLVIFLKYKRHIGVMQGVTVVAALTLLINGAVILRSFLWI
jgi:hypothetical protein